jgi:phosphoribosylaminoimidazole-succinocarboxamide synthase
LIAHNFQGLEGQTVPVMSDDYIESVSKRYIELYENITGEPFVKANVSDIQTRIETNVLSYLKTL